ncbi:MAG: septum formation initiator family protein [bacterium]|nr:septum formation initiator family protein [bacterium]
MKKIFVNTKKFKDITKALKTEKTKIKRLVIAGIAVFVVYVYGFGDYGLYQYYKLLQEESRLKAEVERLETEADELKEIKQQLLKEDPDYIQRIAREKFGLVKPGEKIYKLTPDSRKDR